MKSCCNACIVNNVGCPVGEYKENNPEGCEYWINYEDDLNCALISIKKCGPMTFDQIATRLGDITGPGVKLIQDRAMEKINKKLKSVKWKSKEGNIKLLF